jgi:hypothetical protein
LIEYDSKNKTNQQRHCCEFGHAAKIHNPTFRDIADFRWPPTAEEWKTKAVLSSKEKRSSVEAPPIRERLHYSVGPNFSSLKTDDDMNAGSRKNNEATAWNLQSLHFAPVVAFLGDQFLSLPASPATQHYFSIRH